MADMGPVLSGVVAPTLDHASGHTVPAFTAFAAIVALVGAIRSRKQKWRRRT